MNWRELLFSFEGRASRKSYWLVALIGIALSIAVAMLMTLVGVGSDRFIIFVAVGLAFVIGIAVGVRRLHDRDKSGWWLLLFYGLPQVLDLVAELTTEDSPAWWMLQTPSAAIQLWALIELGFLRGTAGSNRFGPDPLAKAGMEAA